MINYILKWRKAYDCEKDKTSENQKYWTSI